MMITGLTPIQQPTPDDGGPLVASKSGRLSDFGDDGRNGSVPSNGNDSAVTERRRAQRLEIRLPVEFRQSRADGVYVVRTVTRNVSSGGFYLELDSAEFRPGDRLDVEMAIPAADGVSPYPGRATTHAEILRVDPLEKRGELDIRRYALAARFLEPLRFSY